MADLTSAEFKALADAATPGPWQILVGYLEVVETAYIDEGKIPERRGHFGICETWGGTRGIGPDADFIAACGTHRERIYKALLLFEMVENPDARVNLAVASAIGKDILSIPPHTERVIDPRNICKALLASLEAEAQ